ncbi:uncharacterized protein TRIADDRAFT_63910 [Trichoplax adhaerens]|uniref:Uncharacterized protein n=1 Tax=Trichoplax adhaerens TaxID=10228 RepID=B3RTJ8_TRIAD|nr:predicted protein [Trichoplax adhaerens]EDV25645.1 predicted protein [Trichoplax adhaerens]|eukprot:XP_002111678.1 predicted protein [Trichoplax adhaerens]
MKFTLILLASLLFLAIAGHAEKEEPTIIEELKDEAPVEDEEGEVAEKEDEIESLENEFQVKEEDEQPEEAKAANISFNFLLQIHHFNSRDAVIPGKITATGSIIAPRTVGPDAVAAFAITGVVSLEKKLKF